MHRAQDLFFLLRLEVAEGDARHHVIGLAEAEFVQLLAEAGRILVVNKHTIIAPELLAQMIGQMVVQLESEQLGIRSQPLGQLARIASLTRAEFHKDPRLLEVHLIQDPPDEPFGTG